MGMALRIAGVVVSARREGNCLNCMKYCLSKLSEMGFDTLLINFYDYNILPCSHCDYECYAFEIRGREERCPIDDDVPKLYGMLESCDAIIFAIPCYGGHVPALYRAWDMRVAHIPGKTDIARRYEDFERDYLRKVIGFILIGNFTAGTDMMLHEILYDFYSVPQIPDVVVIQPMEYNRSSLKGDLIEEEAVRERLNTFIEMILRKLKRR
ncbi:flavodoxin family protein [Candidatus Korarchaeum cryptofilum]|jgi:multimeric flavodoxin WrbA|uniref:Flavodoxin family protein n=1 Tax=Candidatus Korarchaeum cryptofilum TaxID=498846 RepID=A0A3R9P8T6_9CREN|nr:flavodoxin family protein [Candidatus Korarchaeum cryptofilum]RSN66983.1 flavodoxin family protein [Candidatus Korarchaeum cryptofilum]